MKYFYIAVVVEEYGKYYAFVLKVLETVNLLSELKIPGIIHANICPTKKEAARRVEHWRAVYKANGTYIFD